MAETCCSLDEFGSILSRIAPPGAALERLLKDRRAAAQGDSKGGKPDHGGSLTKYRRDACSRPKPPLQAHFSQCANSHLG